MTPTSEPWQWRPRKKEWVARAVANGVLSLRLRVWEQSPGQWWAAVNDQCVTNPDNQPQPPYPASPEWPDAERAKAAALAHAGRVVACLQAAFAAL